MRFVRVIVASIIFCFSLSCTSDETDFLLGHQFLGEWEIIADSHDPTLTCCEFLKFTLDENTDDFIGHLSSHGPDYMDEGTFEYFTDDQKILLYQNDEYEFYGMVITSDRMILFQDDMVQTYKRVE